MAVISRRGVLVGGGAGVGLVVAWAMWPREHRPNLAASPGEAVFGAWLKIGEDGHVTVAVPQAEHGQGIWTTLAQVVADELGADWRTVGVEPAPLNPLYGNPLGLSELLEGMSTGVSAANPAPVLTAGSSSIRQFERPAREAAASARALLCMAAAARWDADWRACRTEAGFVVHEGKRLRFAELAADAAGLTPPDPPPVGGAGAGTLTGRDVARLDAPAKVDGSVGFAGDVRLPGMVHAAIRRGPIGDSRLVGVDRAAADRVRGVLAVVENPRWAAVAATTWWAANKALEAMRPRFETRGRVVDDASIGRALDAALDGPGRRIAEAGDVGEAFRGGRLVTATYRAAAGLHAAVETPSAAASFTNDRLELWLPTQAPGAAQAAAARAAGLSEGAVLVHPMQIGGSVGQGLDTDAAEQAAVLAVRLRRPVSLVWSRGEATAQDRYRAPAVARMAARLGGGGAILGWQAKIASPATGAGLARALVPGLGTEAALRLAPADRYSAGGAAPPYRLPAYAIDHHPADTGLPTGHFRGGAHGLTCFFTECFLDELAHAGVTEPVSFRIGMLGREPRLARCLSTAASLGGWEGGVPGSGQGIACHAFRGSYIAVMAEARSGPGGRPAVDRLVAAVDCGRAINPDVVRQQVEGGLIVGLAQALGASTGFTRGRADARGFGEAWLPRLADTPDITVELISSNEAPGGVGELGVPPVAPAIANALHAATGFRIRSLPLSSGA